MEIVFIVDVGYYLVFLFIIMDAEIVLPIYLIIENTCSIFIALKSYISFTLEALEGFFGYYFS